MGRRMAMDGRRDGGEGDAVMRKGSDVGVCEKWRG